MRREGQLGREKLSELSDAELDLLAESFGADPDDYLEEVKQWEAEAIEQQRRNAEESRRRGRELLERNHALIEAHRRRTKKGAPQ